MDSYAKYEIRDSRDDGVKYICDDGMKIYVMKIIPTGQYHNKEIEILKKLKNEVDFIPHIVDDFLISLQELNKYGICLFSSKLDTLEIENEACNKEETTNNDNDILCKILIYEYIDGYDLYDYTEKNKLTYKEMNDIAFQLIKIVYKIHALGIFHRDIKLENFVINPEGKVFIIDFGVSHLIQDDYIMTTMIPGSMIYVSREYVKMYKGIIVGHKYSKNKINAVLKSNDIFCLSITLYTLYNDDFPYTDDLRFGDYDMLIKTLSSSKYKETLYIGNPVSNPILLDVVNISREPDYKARILLWNSLSIYLK